ncbi:Ubx7 protein [Pichia kluyveri]|uniref:Ubx7 protein n=1 Tax=Pichia kluyveri TaxID=36015 RepID=A0AAV5R909_PICKL|nr:Ubx7 protein [Pichia kluyveri]
MSQVTDNTPMIIDFSTDSIAAIQASLTLKKPLMLYIETEVETENSNDSVNEWIDMILTNNEFVSNDTKKIILTHFLRLKITKNSQDFNNLVSIIPAFHNILTPCILFIFAGQVIDHIPQDLDPKDVDTKINDLIKKLSSSNLINTSNNVNNDTSDLTPSIPNTDQSTNQSDISNNNTNNVTIPTPIPTNNRVPKKVSTKSEFKTLKEEAAEFAAQKYRENLIKQQNQAKKDRERILQLMEQDRRELENRKLEKIVSPNLDNDTKIHENLHNAKIQNSEIYTIQIKLFDGTTIRHQFKSNTKLLNVREYILKEYPDYNITPFYFFKNIDRTTLGEADENKPLTYLNLNMCTLILKPLEHDETFKVSVAHNNGTFNWLKKKINSYWWPKEEIHQIDTNHSNRNDTVESDSDCDTAYHTPILSSTPSSSSIRPIVSSFNLYGSQGLISSTTNSSDHINTVDAENDESKDKLAESTNTDHNTYTVKDVDDVPIHNGNSISLKFSDEDK